MQDPDYRTMEQKLLDYYGAPTTKDTAHCGIMSKEHAMGFLLSEAAETGGNVMAPLSYVLGLSDGTAIPHYFVVLRNMTTGAEHMHPDSLVTLVDWHKHFMSCDLFTGVELSEDTVGFPKLLAPKPDVDPFTSMEFIKQGIRFRARVVVAPISITDWVSTNIVDLHVETPPLPNSYDALDKRYKGSMQRTRLLHAFAQLGICTEYVGLERQSQAATSVGGAGGSLVDEMGMLELQHGDGVASAGGGGVVPIYMRGEFCIASVETSAGAAVIPAVLAKLNCLHLTLTGPVPLMLYAVSKYSYMVYIYDIGGWGVIMCVNMVAHLGAVKAFFERVGKSQLMPFPGRALPRTLMPEDVTRAVVISLDKSMTQFETMSKKKFRDMKSNASRRAISAGDDFSLYMSCAGLNMLGVVMTRELNGIKWQRQLKTGRAAALSLVNKSQWSQRPSDEQKVDFGVCKLLMCAGIAGQIWDVCFTIDEFRQKLNYNKRPAAPSNADPSRNVMTLADQRMQKMVWNSWKDCHPSEWWRSICSTCKIEPIDMAHAIMAKKSVMELFFPTDWFGDHIEVSNSKSDVEELCKNSKPVHDARENYMQMTKKDIMLEVLLKLDKDPDRAKVQRDFYCTGMAYAILYGLVQSPLDIRATGLTLYVN